VICGETTNTKKKMYIESHVSYQVLYWKYRFSARAIFYPICLKHKLFLMIATILTLLFTILLIFGIGLLIYFYSTDFQTKNIFLSLFLITPSIAIIGLLIKYRPVWIKEFEDNYVTIGFRNEQYAKEFTKINGLDDDPRFNG
jgi:hypothetical protein